MAKKNQDDTTLRNLRAGKKREQALKDHVDILRQEVKALWSAIGGLDNKIDDLNTRIFGKE